MPKTRETMARDGWLARPAGRAVRWAPMAPRSTALAVGAVIGVVLLVFAFVVAPHSCEWGLEAYFVAGVASLAALLVVPFIVRAGASVGGRAGLALALVAAGGGVWLLGLFAADVRIVCRLI